MSKNLIAVVISRHARANSSLIKGVLARIVHLLFPSEICKPYLSPLN